MIAVCRTKTSVIFVKFYGRAAIVTVGVGQLVEQLKSLLRYREFRAFEPRKRRQEPDFLTRNVWAKSEVWIWRVGNVQPMRYNKIGANYSDCAGRFYASVWDGHENNGHKNWNV